MLTPYEIAEDTYTIPAEPMLAILDVDLCVVAYVPAAFIDGKAIGQDNALTILRAVNSHSALADLVDKAYAHDTKLNASERAPGGYDYNELLKLIEEMRVVLKASTTA